MQRVRVAALLGEAWADLGIDWMTSLILSALSVRLRRRFS